MLPVQSKLSEETSLSVNRARDKQEVGPAREFRGGDFSNIWQSSLH